MYRDIGRDAHERAVRHQDNAVGALRAEQRRYRQAVGDEGGTLALDTSTEAGRRLERAMKREQAARRAVHETSRLRP